MKVITMTSLWCKVAAQNVPDVSHVLVQPTLPATTSRSSSPLLSPGNPRVTGRHWQGRWPMRHYAVFTVRISIYRYQLGDYKINTINYEVLVDQTNQNWYLGRQTGQTWPDWGAEHPSPPPSQPNGTINIAGLAISNKGILSKCAHLLPLRSGRDQTGPVVGAQSRCSRL